MMTEFQENMQRLADLCIGKRSKVAEIAARAQVSTQTVRMTFRAQRPEQLTEGQQRVMQVALDYLQPELKKAREIENAVAKATNV